MKKLGILLITLAIVSNCKKKDDDKTAENVLLLSYLSQSSAAQAAAASQASQVRSTVGAVTASVSTAARGNQVTFLLPNAKWTKERLMAYINRETFSVRISSLLNPSIRPTALAASGGTCNSTNCNATLNGTVNCSSGGTVTLENMKVTFNFPKTLSYNSTLDGTVITDKCAGIGADYYNYPKFVSAISSGRMTIRGKSNINMSDYTFAPGTNNTVINTDFSYDENTVVNSDSLNMGNNSTIALKDVTNIVSLRAVGQQKEFSTTTVGSVMTIKITVEEALTGSVSVSGLVGGTVTNVTKTFAGEKFNYRYTCILNTSSLFSSCEIIVL